MKDDKMTIDEALEILRRELWKCNPDTPVPKWLIEKDNPNDIKDFRRANKFKYEALTIAIESVKTIKSLDKIGIKPATDSDPHTP
jgi:hypothetical protein